MRVFVAIDITDRRVQGFVAEFQARAGIAGRPVRPENLHFTLQFLGEVRPDAVGGIVRAMQAVRFASFSVVFRGMGAFPTAGRPRAVWIGTDSTGGMALQKLANQTAKSLAGLGFRPDKQFSPHATILRTREKRNLSDAIKTYGTTEFGTQEITSIKIKQSTLTGQGPTYADLGTVESV